jgi:hypothetical protein
VVAFHVSYSGSGTWHTRYHSEPPNQGGAHDTNDANDSSTVRWSLTFSATVTIPRCARPRPRRPDPCRRIKNLFGALGTSSATGRVSHVHIDGLFPSQNGSVRCGESVYTPQHRLLDATILLRYAPADHTLTVTALDPVIDAINILPGQCLGQGDPIDGLYDNYFTPGFSFASGYGPERWFRAPSVVIPIGEFHHASAISVPLAFTKAGTPPRSCEVPFPSYQRCTTGGSWSGVLSFKAVRLGKGANGATG